MHNQRFENEPNKRISRRAVLASLGAVGAAVALNKMTYSEAKEDRDAFARENRTGDDCCTNYSTQAAFAAAAIPPAIQSVFLHGYHFAGDGGVHVKKRVPAPSPVKAWHSQSADGAWWEVSEPIARPQMFGAKGDGIHDDTIAIQAVIDYGKEVYLPKGDYKVTKTLLITTTAQKISGAGMGFGYGRPNFVFTDFQPITRMIGEGTFAKRIMTRRKHRSSAASPKDDMMSTIIDVEADGVSISDLSLWLNADYSDATPGNYGDDISIGLFVGCRPAFKLRDVGVFGHFRKAGIYLDVTRSLQLPELTDLDGNSLPEGSSGGSFAGGDGTVLNNPFVYGALGPALAVLGAIHTGSAYYDEAAGAITDARGASGFSDFEVFGGRFYSAQHRSGRRTRNPTGYGAALARANMEAEDDFFPASLYIDGWAANPGSTTHGVGALRNMNFYGTRFTSCEAFRIRLGTCDQIKFLGTAWIEGGDFPSTAASWKDTLGVDINPNDYTNVTYGHIATHQTKTGQVVAQDVVGGLNQSWVFDYQRFLATDSNGRTRARSYDSGQVAIADDSAATIIPPAKGGWMSVTLGPDTAGPQRVRSGMVFYDVGSSLDIGAFNNGANFVVSTSDVTGTTGVDGNVTVAVQAGVIKIENRAGGSAVFRYTFF